MQGELRKLVGRWLRRLFSEVVNLRPIAIIVAIVMFGGIWGFWGVFFAIPLATLINVPISVWPRAGGGEQRTEERAQI